MNESLQRFEVNQVRIGCARTLQAHRKLGLAAFDQAEFAAALLDVIERRFLCGRERLAPARRYAQEEQP